MTLRYRREDGPITILEWSEVNIDEDMRENEDDDDTDEETEDPEEGVLVSAGCQLSNVYSGLFRTVTVDDIQYKSVPRGLVAYVQLDAEMSGTEHDTVLFDLRGLEKPGSSDVGRNSGDECYVITGTTKAEKDNCEWKGDDQIKVTTSAKSVSVRVQVKINSKGCFTGVTAKKGSRTTEKKEADWSQPDLQGAGDMDLWGENPTY